MSNTVPAAPQTLAARVRWHLERACRAMGYQWGAVNADVLVTPDQRMVLVEFGARLGGNGSAELLGLVNGIDVTELYVRAAVGESPPVVSRARACAAFLALRADRPGRLVAVHGIDAARATPGVVEIVVSVPPGGRVEPYHRAGAKVGYVLITAPDRGQIRSRLATVTSLLRVEVTPEGSGPDGAPTDRSAPPRPRGGAEPDGSHTSPVIPSGGTS